MSVFNGGDKEAQNVFNQSQPADDRGIFLDKFSAYLHRTGRYSADEATAVAMTPASGHPYLRLDDPLSLPERPQADRRHFGLDVGAPDEGDGS